MNTPRPLGYEKVYLSLCEVADTSFRPDELNSNFRLLTPYEAAYEAAQKLLCIDYYIYFIYLMNCTFISLSIHFSLNFHIIFFFCQNTL